MRKIKESETRVILRSQIKLNPLNPKRHSKENIKLQKKNILKVGILGGIVWNEVTGNVIDGHRRIYAMDEIRHYDGTPETDYEIKVEVVNMDDKTEMEQLTYMAVGNTKADIDLIAKYASEIDINDVGLSEELIKDINAFTDSTSEIAEDIGSFFDVGSDTDIEVNEGDNKINPAIDGLEVDDYEQRKEHMKEVKALSKKQNEERVEFDNAYIILSFSNMDSLQAFRDIFEIETGVKTVKGEDILRQIDI